MAPSVSLNNNKIVYSKVIGFQFKNCDAKFNGENFKKKEQD